MVNDMHTRRNRWVTTLSRRFYEASTAFLSFTSFFTGFMVLDKVIKLREERELLGRFLIIQGS